MELFLKGIVTKEEAVVSGKTRSSAGAFRWEKRLDQRPSEVEKMVLFTLPETNPGK